MKNLFFYYFTKNEIKNHLTEDTTTYATFYSDYMKPYNHQFLEQDTRSKTDEDAVAAIPMFYYSDSVYLASRNYNNGLDTTEFYVRELRFSTGTSIVERYYRPGVRGTPSTGNAIAKNGYSAIVKLKNDLKIIGGDGSGANPYILK